jgi:hypothetical protein
MSAVRPLLRQPSHQGVEGDLTWQRALFLKSVQENAGKSH